jgi:hypothetical protein
MVIGLHTNSLRIFDENSYFINAQQNFGIEVRRYRDRDIDPSLTLNQWHRYST